MPGPLHRNTEGVTPRGTEMDFLDAAGYALLLQQGGYCRIAAWAAARLRTLAGKLRGKAPASAGVPGE